MKYAMAVQRFVKKALFALLVAVSLLSQTVQVQAQDFTTEVQPKLFLPAVGVTQAPMTPRSGNSGIVEFDKVDTVVRGGMQHGALEQCVNKVYTPVADEEGKLRMIGMSAVGNNLSSLPETGDDFIAFIAGQVKDIAITRLNGCNYMVTAVRTQNDSLKLISWFSSADGFERLHDTGSGGMATTEVAITRLGHPSNTHPGAGLVVTAARSSSGYLVMNLWSVNPNTGISLWDTEIDEQASKIAMVAIEPAEDDESYFLGRVVTAFQTPAGNLKLVTWYVDVFGGLTRGVGSGNQAGEVQKIAIERYDTRRVVTAVKNGAGNLQLIAWDLESKYEIDRLEGEDDPTFNDPYAGQVSEIAITAFDFNYFSWDYVATAVRTESGNLRVIAWGIDSDGNIKRHGDSGNQAGAASHVEIGWSQESNRLVTSMRDGDGDLRVISWRAY